MKTILGSKNVSLSFAIETPTAHYFYDRVLQISSGIDDLGTVQWELMLCLLLVWILIAAVLIKGIAILGKISYITAILPYILITALIIQCCILDGAVDGITFYFKPNFSKLADIKIWIDAAVQIFWSLAVCSGVVISMSSYNNFSNNCIRDAVMIAVINCSTSIYAGVAVFAILGYMAKLNDTSVEKIATQGQL